MKKYSVGVLGATGMVGQRLLTLLDGHPWFCTAMLAASPQSAGKRYKEAVADKWYSPVPMPVWAENMTVHNVYCDAEIICASCDFVFCALNLSKDQTRALEERYAKLECPVISNNSACRSCVDVPMVIPEINPEHIEVIVYQKKRLGTKRGFIAVKSNCSVQSFLPALHTFWDLGVKLVSVCTMQAVSGAGKTLAGWREMHDNVIPLIPGEEDKTETEPLKIWGRVEQGGIVPSIQPFISAQCIRVPVSDGHMAAVTFSLTQTASLEQLRLRLTEYKGEPQKLNLPTAPKQPVHYFEEKDRPQTALDRDLERGMACSVGRLRNDGILGYKMICLSHNTLRGAAGGAVLLAELLCAKGYID